MTNANSATEKLGSYAPTVHILHTYEGEGKLCYQDGSEIECRFVAGQFASGQNLLLCEGDGSGSVLFGQSMRHDVPERFVGTTSDGARLLARGHLFEKNVLIELPAEGPCWAAAFTADEIAVEWPVAATPVESRFGITNFKFCGTRWFDQGRQARVLPVPLIGLDENAEAIVVPVRDYTRVAGRLSTVKLIEVTAEIHVPCRWPAPNVERWATELCLVLSVARGTKVQWIYKEELGENSSLIRRQHAQHIAKRYTGWHTIDPQYPGRVDTEQFVATALKRYAALQDPFRLNRGVIDNYLDARLEEDFLELRGAKMAVAIEALKAVFVAQPNNRDLEYVMDSKSFDAVLPGLRRAIRMALQTSGIDESQAHAIASSAQVLGLNRKSFKHIVKALLQELHLEISPRDLNLFVQSRNKLVHHGRFYCQAASEDERKRTPPLKSVVDEFTFLVNVLDRIFLKLLGYSGKIVDWRERVSPEKG